MDLGIIVAQNIRALRLERGLSQKDLADKTNLTVRYISRLENTSPNITLEVIERLAKGLEITPAEIVSSSAISKKPNSISKEALDQAIQLLQSVKSLLD